MGEGCPFILAYYYKGTKANHQTSLQYDEAAFGQVHFDIDNVSRKASITYKNCYQIPSFCYIIAFLPTKKRLCQVGEGCLFILAYYEGTKANHQTSLQYDETVFGQVQDDIDIVSRNASIKRQKKRQTLQKKESRWSV